MRRERVLSNSSLHLAKQTPQSRGKAMALLPTGDSSTYSSSRANSNNMLQASAVVVWEWLNEHGRWRPYSPAVSHQIEAAIRSSDPRGGSVVLGQVDSRLSPYIIDLQSMHQFRQDTGKAWGDTDETAYTVQGAHVWLLFDYLVSESYTHQSASRIEA